MFFFGDYEDDFTAQPTVPPFLLSTTSEDLLNAVGDSGINADTNQLVEQPRSQNTNFKNQLNSFSFNRPAAKDDPLDESPGQTTEITVIEEKRFPFTVVRVSSTVSRGNVNDVIGDVTTEEAASARETTTTESTRASFFETESTRGFFETESSTAWRGLAITPEVEEESTTTKAGFIFGHYTLVQRELF